MAGMIPAPGEKPADWWTNTGYGDALAEQAELDGGLTGNDDPYVAFFHDVPRPLAEEAMGKSRGESEAAYNSPWPLEALPAVPTRVVRCPADRFFPAPLLRSHVVAGTTGSVSGALGGRPIITKKTRKQS